MKDHNPSRRDVLCQLATGMALPVYLLTQEPDSEKVEKSTKDINPGPICTRVHPGQREKAYFVTKGYAEGNGPAYQAHIDPKGYFGIGEVIFEPVDDVPGFNGISDLSDLTLKEMAIAEQVMGNNPNVQLLTDGDLGYPEKIKGPSGIHYSVYFGNVDERRRKHSHWFHQIHGDSLGIYVQGIDPEVFKDRKLRNKAIEILGEDAYNYFKKAYDRGVVPRGLDIYDNGLDGIRWTAYDEASPHFFTVSQTLYGKKLGEFPSRFQRMLDDIALGMDRK